MLYAFLIVVLISVLLMYFIPSMDVRLKGLLIAACTVLFILWILYLLGLIPFHVPEPTPIR